MPTPYTSGPHILTIADASVGEECLEIRCPHRGYIKSIKFNYVEGSGDANCDFEMYTSRLACPPGASVSESLSEAEQGSRDAYSIFGAKSYVAGTPFIELDKTYPFRNKDGSFSDPIRKLYVALRPSGTGAKTFELTLEMDTSPLS